jgi:hypothetical protein
MSNPRGDSRFFYITKVSACNSAANSQKEVLIGEIYICQYAYMAVDLKFLHLVD